MIKWIGKLFKKKVITSIPHSKLEFCFFDSNGLKYYKFPDDMSLPVERFGKLQEFMMWMSASITPNEFDKLIDAGEAALIKAYSDNKSFSKVGYVFTMMRERRQMVVHTELLYNFLAVQAIREDEPTEHFNNAIHLEKIEQFKQETKNGRTYDFFLSIGLKKLNDLFNMSEAEWNQYWQESIQEQEVLREATKLISKEESPIKGSPLTSK